MLKVENLRKKLARMFKPGGMVRQQGRYYLLVR